VSQITDNVRRANMPLEIQSALSVIGSVRPPEIQGPDANLLPAAAHCIADETLGQAAVADQQALVLAAEIVAGATGPVGATAETVHMPVLTFLDRRGC